MIYTTSGNKVASIKHYNAKTNEVTVLIDFEDGGALLEKTFYTIELKADGGMKEIEEAANAMPSLQDIIYHDHIIKQSNNWLDRYTVVLKNGKRHASNDLGYIKRKIRDYQNSLKDHK